MHRVPRLPAAVAAALASLALSASADAATLTLGSDLSASAARVETHPADTAFWLTSAAAGVVVPENGQVMSVTVKGSALKEKGAANPATLIHFQSLDPAGADGARTVYKTSQGFEMPFDNPGAVTTFEPENLCINKGGTVAFNTIGGFKWGGSLTAPLDDAHYHEGTPWQIFAAGNATTAWFSKDEGTKNGMVLTPAGGTNARDGFGRQMPGTELLMKVVVKTGADRGIPCQNETGDYDPNAGKKRELRVAGGFVEGVSSQRPYVTKDRKFNIGVYCETPESACAGTATLQIGTRVLQTVEGVNVAPNSSGKLPFRLGKKDYNKLNKKKSLAVTLVLVSQYGTVTTPMSLKR